jgi:hypothetical protein
MLINHEPAPRDARQVNAESTERLDRDLEEAALTMTRIDSQNAMLEKCVKFTATLRYLLQSLRSSKSDYVDVNIGPHTHSQGSAVNVDGTLGLGSRNPGDGLFASMTDFLPPDFQFQDLNAGTEDLFMSPNSLDNFANGDLFW